jgi:hypothetical protein
MKTVFESTEERDATLDLIYQGFVKIWKDKIKPDMEACVKKQFDQAERDTFRTDILWELSAPVHLFKGFWFSGRRAILVLLMLSLIFLTSFLAS